MSFIVRTAVLAVPLALSMPLVLAQPADPHAHHAVASTPNDAAGAVPAAPAAPAAESAGSAYRSAFDGYRGFTDQPVESWRKANDEVGRIGGWKAYAREGQGAPGGHQHAMPAGHGGMRTGPAASTPAPPLEAPAGHSGHRMP